MANPCLAWAFRYAAAGLWVFPSPPDTKMSYKSARYNGGQPWGATRDPSEIEADWGRWPQANVCIVTGKISGIFVVETDSAAHGVDGEASLRQLIDRFGPWPLTRIAVSPSGSRHFYWKWPANGLSVRNSTSKLGKGIDVRGNGGMVVAPPSRRRDGIYRWENNNLVVDTPDWLLELIAQPDGPRSSRYKGEAEIVHPWLVAETVSHVPTELEWHERNAIVGLAIFRCTGGSDEGFEIWDNWLLSSGRYRSGESAKRWRQMHRSPPTETGYGTLFFRATKANPGWLDELDQKFLAMNSINVDDFLRNHFAKI